MVSGTLKENQRITAHAAEITDTGRSEVSVQEIGILAPKLTRTKSLQAGQVGYVISGMRTTREARVGDTLVSFIYMYHFIHEIVRMVITEIVCSIPIWFQYIPSEWKDSSQDFFEPLVGYENTKQMLFASIFPSDPNDLDRMYSSVDKLCLTDSSVSALRDQSATSLGSGMRCGFLGFLHMEVFLQRYCVHLTSLTTIKV